MTSQQIVITPEAEQNLHDIYIYIAGESSSRIAWNYLSRLEGAIRRIALAPNLGKPDPATGPGVRMRGFEWRASIHYLPREQDILILSIRYAGRQS